jgi:hypothetical protein
MKKNNLKFYIFLGLALLQSINYLIASESVIPASSCSSSSSSSSSLVPRTRGGMQFAPNSAKQNYLKLRAFVARATRLNDNKKLFLGALSIALSVFKQDKETAFITAIRWVMRLKGLEWCVVGFDGWMTQGQNSQSRSIVVRSSHAAAASSSSSGVTTLQVPADQVVSLLADENSFDSNAIDLLTKQSFGELSRDNEAYLLSQVESGSFVNKSSDLVDANSLHRAIQTSDGFLSGLIRENDEEDFNFTITFPSQDKKNILDIHYFRLKDGKLEHVGSVYEIDNPSKPEVKQKLLTTFVSMLKDNEVSKELKKLNAKIEKGQCFSGNQKMVNYSKVVTLIESILTRLERSNNNPLDDNNLMAIHLLAYVHEVNGRKDLSIEALHKISSIAMLQKLCQLHARLS